jgi:polar amino acid transport system substrate-binding protein
MSAAARPKPALLTTACVAALLAGCASTSDRALERSLPAFESRSAGEPAPAPTTASRPCGDPTRSLRPPARLPRPGQMPPGTFMRAIQDRGRLIAGVDQNTLRFSYLNPLTGRLEGFEIDLLRQVTKALLGDPRKIQFKVITTAQRIPAIQQNRVDIVADAMTINCDRARKVAFTTPYFEAGQRVLVSSESSATGVRDLAGKRVCATFGSTSIENIKAVRAGMIPYPVAQRTDCLVALQEGVVDAISTDDAILLGFHLQDPYTRIVGRRFSREPYGMAIAKSHPELVRFVNGVLGRMTRDGAWSKIQEHWLGGLTRGQSRRPPLPRYRD